MVKKIKFNSEKLDASLKPALASHPREESKDFLKKYISATSVVAVALFFGLVIFFLKIRESRTHKREKEAQEAIWRAQTYFENEKWDDALQGDDLTPGFLAIAKKWPKTKPGKLAQCYIGLIYMKKNMYEEAINYLDKVKFSDPIMQAVIWCIKGDAYSNMKRYPEALKWYKKAASVGVNDQTTPLYLRKIAAVSQVLGKKEEVRKSYERIAQEFPESPDYHDAQKYLGLLDSLDKK